MLRCNCGYMGVNLIPNYEDNTARCPECNRVFVGIPAENAIYDENIVYRNGKLERKDDGCDNEK